MKNRIVGMIILGISVVIGLIIFLFNRALTQIVNTSCSHGTSCPMWGTLKFQTNISLGIMLVLALIGFYLAFFSKGEITKDEVHREKREINSHSYKSVLAELDEPERFILEKIIQDKGTIFQSNLVEITGWSKVKVTRILDRLEGRGLIERKRRGMTNVVILKHPKSV